MAPTSETSPTAGETAGDSNTKAPAPENPSAAPKNRAKAADDAAPGTVKVEFVGVAPYGREFHRDRTISKAAFASLGIDNGTLKWIPERGWLLDVPADNGPLMDFFKAKANGFKVHED